MSNMYVLNAKKYEVRKSIDEDSEFTVKSSVDGYIFVVRETVNPQYSAMASAKGQVQQMKYKSISS